MAEQINAIVLDSAFNMAAQIIQCSSSLRQQVSRLNEITAQLLQMFSTTSVPPDYSLIETQLGLPHFLEDGVTPSGYGLLIWDIINNANTQIASEASVQKFLNWIAQK